VSNDDSRVTGARFERGFAFDPDAAVAHLRDADPRLARIMEATGPFRMQIKPTPSVLVALAEAIVYQQLSGKAAGTIFGRVGRLFPRGPAGMSARALLELDDEALRGAGVSRNKQLALRDLAERIVRREIPTLPALRAMPDEEVIAVLTRVRGIGRWTAEMLLMWNLGRPDVLAVDDLGVRQGHAFLLGRRALPDRRRLLSYAERWRPFRSVASWYLWRAVELARREHTTSRPARP
jgi:3-methyladenine DNA glycosylase/8-oxoguanine DNA glycosylase